MVWRCLVCLAFLVRIIGLCPALDVAELSRRGLDSDKDREALMSWQ